MRTNRSTARRRRTWLLVLGAGAAGVAGWQVLRRRSGSDYVEPGATGTAGGNPIAGVEADTTNAVRTGTDLTGLAGGPLGGPGTTAPAEPTLGTTPNGGY